MNNIDIICIGEVLIDFIGHKLNVPIVDAQDYHRFLGGSPTNVAVNAARLGLQSVIVATCGLDGLGNFIIDELQNNNVNTSLISQSEVLPTSVIFVSKSTETPEFIPYREADSHIFVNQLPDEVLANAKIFHTTCFALSRNPARQTILNRAKKAKSLGLQLSIDINFSVRIWPDREEAKKVLAEYCSFNPLIKLSLDDCSRLFEEAKSEEFIFDYFHKLGASRICLTKGKKGVILSDLTEGKIVQKALIVEEVKDTTGAGDAFWTGFLYAQLHEKSLTESITIAQKLAYLKLQNVGGLPEGIDFKDYLKI
jgi:fructokinase